MFGSREGISWQAEVEEVTRDSKGGTRSYSELAVTGTTRRLHCLGLRATLCFAKPASHLYKLADVNMA